MQNYLQILSENLCSRPIEGSGKHSTRDKSSSLLRVYKLVAIVFGGHQVVPRRLGSAVVSVYLWPAINI